MIPRDPGVDNTLAFFREGYVFIGNHCGALGSDVFQTRIMLRKVVCMMGEEAARRFYDGQSFTRNGAMPQTTLRLLQDKGSVQSLDGAAHNHRKQLFMRLADDDASAQALALAFKREWEVSLPGWRDAGTIVFHDAITDLLTGAACAWVGISLKSGEREWLASGLAAMIAGAGSVGPRTWAALLKRRRIERWAREHIRKARDDKSGGETPLHRLARFHENGELLPADVAAVELLNLLRPTVAVARFLTFAALALHEWKEAAAWLAQNPPGHAGAFADEVRRYYPFFPVIGGLVRAPFTWNDHAFSVGDWVLLGLYATNHDPRLWDEPEHFRPERFLGYADSGFALVPQGAGDHRNDHRCPGERITRTLIATALALLRSLHYDIPKQDLQVPLNRFPTLPRDGLRMKLR